MARRTSVVLILCWLGFGVPSATADDARAVFDALYGSDVARVRATREASDDVRLAEKLLEAAREAAAQPALVEVICAEAYELTSGTSEGYATALAAAALGMEHVREKSAAWCEKGVAIRQKEYDAARGEGRTAAGEVLIEAMLALADVKGEAGETEALGGLYRQALAVARSIRSERREAIEVRLQAMGARERLLKEAARLKAELARTPDDASLRNELVRLLVVELDSPASAAKHVDGPCEAAWKKYVPAASRRAEEAPELACLELGEWYRGLGEEAPESAKVAMYQRAHGYYQRFLLLHGAEDLRRMQASLAVKKVEEALKRLGSEAGGEWVDVLKLVAGSNDAVGDGWQRLDDGIHVRPGGYLGLPVSVEGSYEAEFRFTRTSGSEAVMVRLPAGETGFHVLLSAAGGEVGGVAAINGQDVRSNGTGVRPSRLENGRTYVLGVRVAVKGEEVGIEVKLDGETYTRWQGPMGALRPLGEAKTAPVRIVVSSHRDPVVWHGARVRVISGELLRFRPDVAKRVTAKEGWVDLMALTDLAKDVQDGKWTKTPQGLLVAGRGTLRLPMTSTEGYELEVRCTRVGGNGPIELPVPVGLRGVTVALGAFDSRGGGLSCVRGAHCGSNETQTVLPIETGKPYAIAVRVVVSKDQADIVSAVNGQPWLRWQGPVGVLSTWSRRAFPLRASLYCHDKGTSILWHAARFRVLSGETTLARSEK